MDSRWIASGANGGSDESLSTWKELVLRFPISRRAIHRLHRCGFEDGGKGDSGQEEGGGRGGEDEEVQLLAICHSQLRPLVIQRSTLDFELQSCAR